MESDSAIRPIEMDSSSNKEEEVIIEKEKNEDLQRSVGRGGHAPLAARPSLDTAVRWTADPRAQKKLANIATFLYAILMIFVSFVIENSPAWRLGKYASESIYHAWMFGLGSVFYFILFVTMLKPRGFNCLKHLLNRFVITKLSRKLSPSPPPSWCGEGSGSLYLRTGAFIFGVSGLALYGLEIYACVNDEDCLNEIVIDDVFAILFIVFQTTFVLFYSKITLNHMVVFCKIGFMHLFAVNLWMWVRFVNAKMEVRTRAWTFLNSKFPSRAFLHRTSNSTVYSRDHNGTGPMTREPIDSNHTIPILPSLKRWPELGTMLITFLIQFAILGAGVMYVIWIGIDRADAQKKWHEEDRRKQKLLRIDFSSSHLGITLGAVLFSMAIVCAIVYGVHGEGNYAASQAFIICELVMFCVMLLACLLALWKMRLLYFNDIEGNGGNLERLDKILLIFGLAGEIMYCTAELDIFGTRQASSSKVPREIVAMNCLRIILVVVQTLLILIAFMLRADPSKKNAEAGKQFITFLAIANVALFLWHVYEGIIRGYGYLREADRRYYSIIAMAAPLIVLYSFQSSVCFVRIWIRTYSKKIPLTWQPSEEESNPDEGNDESHV